MNSKKNGFTLVELIAVIVIIGLLVGLTIPVYFTIANNVKNNEYQSKKKYIEDSALQYAQDFSSSSSLVFTVGRLVSSGYVSADKYKNYSGLEVPFVVNPTDPEDNLACRTVTISMDNYEYSATLSDEKDPDCSLITMEVRNDNMGIKAYGLDGNMVSDTVDWETKNEELKWINKDVAILVSPKYENVKNISLSYGGNSKEIEYKDSFCKELAVGTIINESSCENMIIVRAKTVLKTSVSVGVLADNEINTSTIKIKIDKEAPAVTTETYEGWSRNGKQAIAYLSDGNGSGEKGLYLTENNNPDEINEDNFFVAVSQGVVTITHGIGTTDALKSGAYYMWTKDNIGNISNVPTVLEIRNVIPSDALGFITITSNNNTFNSRSVTATVTAYEGEIGIVSACITSYSYSCDYYSNESYTYSGWVKLDGNQITKNITYLEDEGSGLSKTLYAYVKDGMGNVKKLDSKTYKFYQACSNIEYVDTSYAYDKYLPGVRCEDSDLDVNLNSISVTPTKLTYNVGETFSFAGTVSASYKDGNTTTLESGYVVNGPDMTTPGTKYVTVFYKGKSTNYAITVREATGISVSDPITNFYSGDRYTFGGKVFVNYSDGSSSEITSGYTTSSPNMSTGGVKTVKVTYQNFTATYDIIVNTISRIELTDQTTEYLVGATYSFDGKVYVYYSNGYSKKLSSSEYKISSKPDLSTGGEKDAVISYNGKTASYKVKVYGIEDLIITNLTQTYKVGDTFSFDGKVTVKYENNTQRELNSNEYIVSDLPDMNTPGIKPIKVSFNGYSKTININVNGIKNILLSGQKTSYYIGDTFSFDGNVDIVFDDDSTLRITSGYTVTNKPNMSVAGVTQVSVNYSDKTATYSVTVYGVTSLEITGQKTSYLIGESFSNSMTVKAVYGDGTNKTVNSGSYTVTTPDMTTAGKKTVTVTYFGVSATYDITIYGIKELNLSGMTTKYYTGDSYSFDGIVTVTYENDSSQSLTSGYTVTNKPNMNVAGTTTISVTYFNKTTTYDVTVYSVTSLEISNNTTTYLLGESFNNSMTVKAVYGDGTKKTVSSGSYTVTTPDMTTTGTKQVTVTYSTVSATFDITVYGITSLEISGQKTSYLLGDNFNNSMTVKAVYGEGTKKTVSSGSYTVTTPNMTTAGTKQVIVTYSTVSATFDITIYGIKELNLSGMTTKYYTGNTYSFNGTVTAIYEDVDSTTKVISSGNYTVTNKPNMNVAGTTTVSVTYLNKTATYDVTVYGITSLEISGQKTSYLLEEAFNSSMTVKAVYGDGTKKTVSSGSYTVTTPDMTTSGTKTVTVTYSTVSETFNIVIHPITKINVSGATSSFFVGDTFDYNGLVVKAEYDNGALKTLTSGYTVSTPDMTTAGVKLVTVTYKTFNATYYITVEAQPVTDTFPKVFEIAGSCIFNGLTETTANNITGANCKDSTGKSYTDVKFINTGISLFNDENYNKDFEIYLEIEQYTASAQPATQSTLMNTKYEGGKYPGTCFRKSNNDLDLTQKFNNGVQKNAKMAASSCTSMKLVRKKVNGVIKIYYSFNGSELTHLQDITVTSEKFDTPVWFGASPTTAAATAARRYIKATLKNMYIKLGTYHD